MNEDQEYFNECMNAIFFFYKEKILLSDLTNLPTDEEMQNFPPDQIEKKYNHFHLSFITPDLPRQREYAIEIWKNWRTNFDKLFPNKHIEIQITDDGSEVTLWVYCLKNLNAFSISD